MKKFAPKSQNQKTYLRAIQRNKVVFCTGPAGTGKAQPLDSIVQTPSGPIKMGDIKTGDFVLNPNGKSVEVLQIYPQGIKDVYVISFNDGTKVECCGDHLWEIVDSGSDNKIRVVDTNWIKKHIYRGKQQKSYRCHMPVCHPIELIPVDVSIDPYILGCLLGDGCLQQYRIRLSTADHEMVDSFVSEFGIDNIIQSTSRPYDYEIKNKTLHDDLQRIGLIKTKSATKFIPENYKHNTIAVRHAVLQGLFDTDGSMCGNKVEYVTVSEQLAKDVQWIVESLGGTCKITTRIPTYTHNGQRKEGQLAYRCYIKLEHHMPFRLSRKAGLVKPYVKYRTKRVIVDVQYSRTVETQCILIDDPRHLYLTDHFIPTHNTAVATRYGITQLLDGSIGRLIICRPLVQAGEDTGFLPGGIEEKLDPYVRPVFDELKPYITCTQLAQFIKDGMVEIVPFAFMRGRNFHNAYIIADEIQNATYEQIRMLLTRIGHESKMVLNGDPHQSDLQLKDQGALVRLANVLQTVPDVAWVQLENEDIIREQVVADMLAAMEAQG